MRPLQAELMRRTSPLPLIKTWQHLQLPSEGGNYWASIDISQMLAFSHNAWTHKQNFRLRNTADGGFCFSLLFAKACALQHFDVFHGQVQKWLFSWISLLPCVLGGKKNRACHSESSWFLYFLESHNSFYLLMGSIYLTPIIYRSSL